MCIYIYTYMRAREDLRRHKVERKGERNWRLRGGESYGGEERKEGRVAR